MTVRTQFALVALTFALATNAVLAQQQAKASPNGSVGGYRLLHEYKPGGEGGWDYLTMDPASRRLYISRGTHVQILNIDSGKLEGDITDLKGVHGIALDQADNKGFISDGRDNSVVIFDLKEEGQFGAISVLGLVMLALTFATVALVQAALGRDVLGARR